MNCIVVDDEPLAREAIQLHIAETRELMLLNSFSTADAAAEFLTLNKIDLIFLDIQMPGTSGIDFAKYIPINTLVIFTTAYNEYALDSYEVEAIDYLIKPVSLERFQKAVSKAASYLSLLKTQLSYTNIETIADDYFFVKADRKYIKIIFKDILFIEGLKDYVILQIAEQKIITAINIKTIYDQLPQSMFVRVSKSYIINVQQINSFDNNAVFIQKHEIPIGNAYRSYFFDEFVTKKLLSR